jgi:hypothetical protein
VQPVVCWPNRQRSMMRYYTSRKRSGETTLAEKGDGVDVGTHYRQRRLRLLLGLYSNIYALIPAAFVLAGIAYFLASKQGLSIGVLSLVLATVSMQLCYFVSVVITVFMDNFEPVKAPSDELL